MEEKPSQTYIKLEHKNEALEFLTNNGLEKYHSVFIDNGIEEMEILLELNEEHLVNMNIPLGHRLKILKKIKEIKGKENSYKEIEPLKVDITKPEKKIIEACIGDDSGIPQGDSNEKDSSEMFREAIEQLRNYASPTKHKAKSKNTEDDLKKMRLFEPVTQDMLPREIKGIFHEGT